MEIAITGEDKERMSVDPWVPAPVNRRDSQLVFGSDNMLGRKS